MADGGQLPGLDGMEVEVSISGLTCDGMPMTPWIGLFDDFIEYANCASDGYTDLFGAGAVPLDTEGSMSGSTRPAWGCSCCRHWIGLIALIAEPCEFH